MMVFRQAAGLTDPSQNNDNNNNKDDYNNKNFDHAASNRKMAVQGRSPESIALLSKERNSRAEACGAGWDTMEGKYIQVGRSNQPIWCPMNDGFKWLKVRGGRLCSAPPGLTVNQVKQVCQSNSGCKAFAYVRDRSFRGKHFKSAAYLFKTSSAIISPANKDPSYLYNHFVCVKLSNLPVKPVTNNLPAKPKTNNPPVKPKTDNNDDDNDMGPDLGKRREALQDLKKLAESINKDVGNVITKDDLKQMVEKVGHMLEEQLHEAGKHIMENRKYIKRVNEILESILKSGGSSGGTTSTRRRRRRRSALLQRDMVVTSTQALMQKLQLLQQDLAASSKALLQKAATSTTSGNKFGAAWDFDKDDNNNNNMLTTPTLFQILLHLFTTRTKTTPTTTTMTVTLYKH